MPPAAPRDRDWLSLHAASDAEDAVDSASEDDGAESRAKGISQPRSAKRRRLDIRSDSGSEDDAETEDEDRDRDRDEAAGKEGDGGDGDAGPDDGAADTTAAAARAEQKSSKPADAGSDQLITNPSRLKPLSKEELAASKAATAKTGVVYLSRIPPFMKPMKVKDLLSRWGEVGRVFLAPEDPKAYARRVRFGGNKKKNYEEGWVEFKNKKDAKLVAETLNTQIIGGKKGSYYHDDVWNIKYLPKFKWHHLQAQIALENASRQARLRAELAHETRVNKTYLKNVERAKMVESMEAKKERKRKQPDDGAGEPPQESLKMRRQFRQNKPIEQGKPAKSDGPAKDNDKVKRLLSKVF